MLLPELDVCLEKNHKKGSEKRENPAAVPYKMAQVVVAEMLHVVENDFIAARGRRDGQLISRDVFNLAVAIELTHHLHHLCIGRVAKRFLDSYD